METNPFVLSEVHAAAEVLVVFEARRVQLFSLTNFCFIYHSPRIQDDFTGISPFIICSMALACDQETFWDLVYLEPLTKFKPVLCCVLSTRGVLISLFICQNICTAKMTLRRNDSKTFGESLETILAWTMPWRFMAQPFIFLLQLCVDNKQCNCEPSRRINWLHDTAQGANLVSKFLCSQRLGCTDIENKDLWR